MDRKPIEAILFDLDNTLIETALASRVAIEKVRLLNNSIVEGFNYFGFLV